MIEKDCSYFEKKYDLATKTADKTMIYQEIKEIINKYNDEIIGILNTEDIMNLGVQKKLIFYQNNKISCMSVYNILRRKDIMMRYFRKIDKARTISQIKVIKEDIAQQRIKAPEIALYLTDEERDYIIKQIQEKYKNLVAIKES